MSCFKAALNNRYLVADSALYTTDTLQSLHLQKQLLISRVPLNIKAAKELVNKAPSMPLTPVERHEGYDSTEVTSNHGEVEQRWAMYRNERCGQSEQKALTKRMRAKSLKEAKGLEMLSKKAFRCREDALKAFTSW